jgi:hypothetical protein
MKELRLMDAQATAEAQQRRSIVEGKLEDMDVTLHYTIANFIMKLHAHMPSPVELALCCCLLCRMPVPRNQRQP